MIIKLKSDQVPDYWEVIKFCLDKVMDMYEDDMPAYFNEVLHALLNDKAHCWIRLDDDRNIVSLAVTRITSDKLTGQKRFWINCVYSFNKTDDKIWIEDGEILRRFAIDQGCSYIYFRSGNERVWKIAELIGCTERFRVFARRID